MKKEGDLLVSRKVSLFFLLLFRTLFRPLMRPEPQCAATHGIHRYVRLHDASMGITFIVQKCYRGNARCRKSEKRSKICPLIARLYFIVETSFKLSKTEADGY